MKVTVILFLLFFIKANFYSQLLDSKNKSSIQVGDFVCRINNCLVFSNTNDDGEYASFTIYYLDLITGNKKIIDSQLTYTNWVKLSDSVLAYIKSDKLFFWNSNTKKKSVYIDSKSFSNIIGLGFNQKNKVFLLVEANYKNNMLRINIINEQNKIIFNYQIEYNSEEAEGIYPRIQAIANYFVMMVQDKLYMVDLTNTKPSQKLISDRCDDFAINDTLGILYYKFFTDTKTEGYYLPFGKRKAEKITNILNDKISNCIESTLITANIDNILIPVYKVCNTSFIFSELNWNEIFDVIIYKDDKLTVRFPHLRNIIDDSSFEWNWKGF